MSTGDRSFECRWESDAGTYGLAARKEGEPTVCHYLVTRASNESPWKLRKAWRTDETGKVIEELSVP